MIKYLVNSAQWIFSSIIRIKCKIFLNRCLIPLINLNKETEKIQFSEKIEMHNNSKLL